MIGVVFQFINDIVTINEPIKSFVVCGIYTLILFFLVLLIGRLVNMLENQQMKLLSKCFNQKVSLFICNRLTFPGVMIHELSHALFATIFGAKVTKMRLMTLRDDNRLGYIEYVTMGSKLRQGLQHTFCSCAPTVMGIILELLFFHMLSKGFVTGIGWKVFVVYMMISIGDHMSMSSQDIKNYLRGSWAALSIAYIILLVLRFC